MKYFLSNFWALRKNDCKSRITKNVCLSGFLIIITPNVLGIAESGGIEAKSFDFAPRRAKTNFYELNLKIKNEFYSFLADK